MNNRLLSQEQKRRNRRERFRRNRCQKASRRREAALVELRDPVLLSGPFVSALDCTKLLTAPHLTVVRGLVRRLNRLAGTLPDSAQPAGIGRCVPRPRRTLWRQNRGTVPKLAAEPTNVDQFLGIEKVLERARDMLATDGSAKILYFLTNAIGLNPSQCAALVSQAGLTFDSTVIREVEHAHQFRKRLAVAQETYRAMVAAGELKIAKGIWGFFDSGALYAILPAIHLPHVLRRASFLVRLKYRAGRIVCLDIHGMSYRGLCRHPVD